MAASRFSYGYRRETSKINFTKYMTWTICLAIVAWSTLTMCSDETATTSDTAKQSAFNDDKELNRFHLKRAIKQSLDIMTQGARQQMQWSFWKSPESDLENIDLNLVKPIEDAKRLNELMDKLLLIQKSGLQYKLLQKDLPKGISPKIFIGLTEKLVSPLLTPMSHMFESTMLLVRGKEKFDMRSVLAIPQSIVTGSKQQLKVLQRTDSTRQLTIGEMLFVLIEMSSDVTSWIWLKDTSTPAERTCDFKHRLLMEQFQLLMDRNKLIKNLFINLFNEYVSNSSRKCLRSVCKLIEMDTSVEIADMRNSSQVTTESLNVNVEKGMCELMNMMQKMNEEESSVTNNNQTEIMTSSDDQTCSKPTIEQLRQFRLLAANKPQLINKLTSKYNKHHLMGIMRLVWACLTLKQTTSHVIKALDWYTTTLCNQLSWCIITRVARLQCPLLDYHYELNQACDLLPNIETSKTIHGTNSNKEDDEEEEDR